MGTIFDILVDPLSLSLSPIWEWIILLIIGEIAYNVAFRFVGDMYGGGWIQTSIGGSIIHWIIRLLVYFFAWFVTETAIQGTKWIYANRRILLIVGLAAFGVLIIYSVIRYFSENY